jgi:hypothetical protein
VDGSRKLVAAVLGNNGSMMETLWLWPRLRTLPLFRSYMICVLPVARRPDKDFEFFLLYEIRRL